MKALLLLFLAGVCTSAFSQSNVSADLYVGQPYITDAGGGPVNTNAISVGSEIKLHIDFLNLEQKKIVPANTFKVIIDLGNELQLASNYDLATAPMANYFTWKQVSEKGNTKIIGELNNTLPGDFAGLGVFDLKAINTGTGKAVSELNFTSNNNAYNVIDPDHSNDKGLLAYTITDLSPLSFTNFDAVSRSCSINAEWKTDNQSNIDHYELEVSKTGMAFTKIKELTVMSTSSYNCSIQLTDAVKSPVVYLRVKAVLKDRSSVYSISKALDGDCSKEQLYTKKKQLYLYPNPVTDGDHINLAAREGSLDGRYRLTLLDKFGKTYQVKEMTFANIKSLKYQLVSNLRPGKYILQVAKADGSNSHALEFEKL